MELAFPPGRFVDVDALIRRTAQESLWDVPGSTRLARLPTVRLSGEDRLVGQHGPAEPASSIFRGPRGGRAHRRARDRAGPATRRVKTTAVGDRLAVNRQVTVLVQEVADAMGIDYETYREVAEVLVDTWHTSSARGVWLDVGGSDP
jgi:hypothetical protein